MVSDVASGKWSMDDGESGVTTEESSTTSSEDQADKETADVALTLTAMSNIAAIGAVVAA